MSTNYRSRGLADGFEAAPLLEIACLGLAEPAPMRASGLVVQAESGLRSRSLAPRFQDEFDGLSGCLYRLGLPGENGGALSAYELLSPASREAFPPSALEFAPAHRAAMERLLEEMQAASPEHRLLFTSDWQYGPEWAHRFGPLTLAEFWSLHATRHLYLNTAYEIAPAT
jgi:hypothetical protein